MIDHHSIFLLVSALLAVIGLILLIAVFKLNPFISLFLASLSLAVVAGMPLHAIVHSFEMGVGGTLIGALIMGVLRNGLNLLGVSSFLQQVVIGLVIVFAVLLDTLLKAKKT